jgi:Holliday junction DNA helicase RuvB
LRFYEVDELIELGTHSGEKLGIGMLHEDILEVIAQRSRGTPRYMNNYLKWIRDFKLFEKVDQVTVNYVKDVLWKRLKIDELGLRPLDRNYLRVLSEVDTPLGIEAIASRLRQAEVTLHNTVEPFLLYSGLVLRIRNGRIITDEGREHLKNLRRKR